MMLKDTASGICTVGRPDARAVKGRREADARLIEANPVASRPKLITADQGMTPTSLIAPK